MSSNQSNYSEFRLAQQTYKSADGAIKYMDQGKGEVLVLLHGVPTSGWLYRNMISNLAKQYRVIVPDMLGFGSSDSPAGYEVYSEENHARRLVALMDYLKISTWTHVMHDAGGLWTWELFRFAQNRVQKLVILNTIIYEDGFAPPIRFEKGFLAKTVMWSYRNGVTTNMMLNGLFRSGLTKNNLSKEDIMGYKKPLLEGKTNAMYYFFTQTCNSLKNYRPLIQQLNIPVMVIWGKNDSFLKWEPQKDAVISDLNISEENIHLLNAKHFIQEEEPNKISTLILNFVK